jgi:hypothetical protein
MKKRKVMKLVDPETGEMVCKVCGAIHWASLKSGGRYYCGSWQCQNRCTLDTSQGLVKLPN